MTAQLLKSDECAKEPIHIPGAIQPHGYLLIVSPVDETVLAASQNLADALDLSISKMVGRPLSDFVRFAGVAEGARAGPFDDGARLTLTLRSKERSGALDCVVHTDGGVLMLELQPATPAERMANLFGEVRAAIERIGRSGSVESLCQVLAVEVRRICAFDRVLVYRFDEDWNGVVIAEDRLSGSRSYLGYAFPASDIPAQARALYLVNTVRTIPDAAYAPSPILPPLNPLNGRAFDLTKVGVRSISPVHLVYLANMGVAASMSVSIVRDNRLWGLIVGHHMSPRILTRDVLQSCDLVAHAGAWCLGAIERDGVSRSLSAVRRLETILDTDGHPDFRGRLTAIGDRLLETIGADGLALLEPTANWTHGSCPAPDDLKGLTQWLDVTGEDRVVTDELSRLYAPAADLKAGASGLVAARLGAGWLIAFRAEWSHANTWAGKPHQADALDPGAGPCDPRASFEAWREVVEGRSAPWTAADLAALDEVHALLVRGFAFDQMRQLLESQRALTEAKLAAEAANRAKSSFLAQMSHEIRTPLNGVLGMAQVMAAGPLSEGQRSRLQVIQSSGASLLTILSDILDLSKIEAGRMDLEDVPFDIADVAHDAFAVFQSIASAKGLAYTLEVRDGARGTWRGDGARVRQLLSNLVSNALKFTTKGEVRVTVDAETLDGRRTLTLSVADTGIGVSPDALPTLFDAFVQADTTTNRRFGGTGLGLTICRRIAEHMNGGIEVRSDVGRGTTFHVRLQLAFLGAAGALSRPQESVPAEGAPLSALRVLAADDNATNRVVLDAILGSFGISATIVENGRQAVEAWSASDVDLVLMDIEMPVLDGLAAVAEIRRREGARGARPTKIFALSANAMTHQIAEYLASGFDGHVAKPLVITTLYGVLLATAESGPSKSPAAPSEG